MGNQVIISAQLCPKSMPFATTRSPLIKHELKLRAKYSVVMQQFITHTFAPDLIMYFFVPENIPYILYFISRVYSHFFMKMLLINHYYYYYYYYYYYSSPHNLHLGLFSPSLLSHKAFTQTKVFPLGLLLWSSLHSMIAITLSFFLLQLS